MVALILYEGDEIGVAYLQPAPEALNYMALGWWANLIQKCHGEHQKGNRNYGAQFSSSLAVAYEIQSWALNHKQSELSKACFFRRLALALARKANNDIMAALKTKCAFSMLVKATFVSGKCFVLEALRLAREAIVLKPSTAGTKMLLARILLWFVCDFDAPDDAMSDLELAIKYVEECMVESPNEFNHVYGAESFLQRAFEARYILRGEEDDIRRALSLARGKGSENLEEVANSYSRRLSVAWKEYVADNRALDEVMRDMEWETSENATHIESQPQGLRKIYHLITPGLAKEAIEAGLLACQSPVEVEDDGKQAAPNFLIGLNYLAQRETRRGRQYNLENAISYLEAARNEESADTEKHLLSSLFLAEARWELGRARHVMALFQAGMESMALLLENLTVKPSPSRHTLIDMMERSYFFWKTSHRITFLSNAVRFVSYLLQEDKTEDVPPNELSAILCKGGEIAADIHIVEPDRTLLQESLWSIGRDVGRTGEQHSMHVFMQCTSRHNTCSGKNAIQTLFSMRRKLLSLFDSLALLILICQNERD